MNPFFRNRSGQPRTSQQQICEIRTGAAALADKAGAAFSQGLEGKMLVFLAALSFFLPQLIEKIIPYHKLDVPPLGCAPSGTIPAFVPYLALMLCMLGLRGLFYKKVTGKFVYKWLALSQVFALAVVIFLSSISPNLLRMSAIFYESWVAPVIFFPFAFLIFYIPEKILLQVRFSRLENTNLYRWVLLANLYSAYLVCAYLSIFQRNYWNTNGPPWC